MLTQFLINKISKGKSNEDPSLRNRLGYLGSGVGIIVNLTLFILKFIVGFMINSISVTADAFNNLSDTLSSIITLFGFKLASAPPDEDHPYGHGRIEYFSGLIISILVLYVGITFLVSSIKKIINPEDLIFQWVPIILFLISILSKVWLSSFNYKLGDLTSSNALKASALDAKGDVMISSTVVIGLLLSHFLNLRLDGYIGLFVAAMIIKNSIGLIRDTINPLLGEKVDKDLIANIEEIIINTDEIYGVHDTVVHNYGPNTVLSTTHVEVRDDILITVIHDIIDDLEKRVEKELGVELVIHMDPVITKNEENIEKIKTIYHTIKEQKHIKNIHDMRFRGNKFIADVVIKDSVSKEDAQLIMENTEKLIKDLYPGVSCELHLDINNIVVGH